MRIGEQSLGEFLVTTVVFTMIMLGLGAFIAWLIWLVTDWRYLNTFGGSIAGLFLYMAKVNLQQSVRVLGRPPHPASIIFPLVMAGAGVFIAVTF